MAHKRVLMPEVFATGEKLTSDMVAIGMRFAANPSTTEPNIEDTLVAASIEGIIKEDYRVLSLLVDWFGVHFERVNVDRLTKMVGLIDDKKVKAFWAALAHWQKQDWRLKKLQKIYKKPRLDLINDGTDFQIERHGEDDRFKGSVLRVPAKLLRHRLDDILSPSTLAKRHKGYYFRIMIGPSYRADMWAIIEYNFDISAAELARKTYGSFPTAWAIKKDCLTLRS